MLLRYVFVICFCISQLGLLGQVVISDDSTVVADPSAALDINITGTTKKGVLMPRVTQAQRLAIDEPAQGLMVYQTDGATGVYVFDGISWGTLRLGSGDNGTTPAPALTITSITPTSAFGSADVQVYGSGFSSVPTVPNEVLLIGGGEQYRALVVHAQENALVFTTPSALPTGTYTVRVLVNGQSADFASLTVPPLTPPIVSTVAGTGETGFRDGPSGYAQMGAVSLFLNSTGDIIFSDQGIGSGYTIRKIDSATGRVTTIAGGSVTGIVDNADPLQAGLALVLAITLDDSQNILFFSNPDFTFTESFLRKIDATTGAVTTLAGGAFGYVDDPDPANVRFGIIQSMAADANGNIYFVQDRRIRRYDKLSGAVTTIAGSGAFGDLDNSDPLLAQFGNPFSLVVDGTGVIYLIDSQFRKIKRIDGGGVTTVAGSGGTSYVDNSDPLLAEISPNGMVLSATGDALLFSDFSLSGRVLLRTYDVNTPSVSTVFNVPFGYQDGPISVAKLNGIGAMAVTPSGNLVTGEYNRIRLITF